MTAPTKRPRGRPKLPADAKKRSSMAFRPTPKTRDRLEWAARDSGRSLSQEIEWRLERSLEVDDERRSDFGDDFTLKLMRSLATAKVLAEALTGGDAYKDPAAADAAYDAMVGILDVAFHARPEGTHDKTRPDTGQDAIVADPLARNVGQNIRDAVLEGVAPLMPQLDAAFTKQK